IHHHADVGGILAGLAHVRDLDELEGCAVHADLEFLVALPVAVGLLDDDRALQQQALEHAVDVELLVLRVLYAERDVLEVAEQRHVAGLVSGHVSNPLLGDASIPSMNGAESLARTLLAGGVDTCFANPGTSEMHFVSARDRVAGLRCILGLAETAVAGFADRS